MNIHEAINAIMLELEPIGKDKKNNKQGFSYRGVDDVMNALQPVMAKHGIYVVPEALNHAREERTTSKGGALIYSIVTMRYTFYSVDGSSVSAVVIGEGMDSGDKATNKAMSVAYKYACFQVFSIPTEETHPDPDAEVHSPAKKSEPKKKQNNAFENAKIKTVEEIIKGSKYTMGGVLKSCLKNYNKVAIQDLTDEEFADLTTNLIKAIEDDKSN